MFSYLEHGASCGCSYCSGTREDASADPDGGSTAGNGKAILTPADAATNLLRAGKTWHLNNYGVLDDGVINYGFWSSYEELASSYYVSVDGVNRLEEVEKRDKFSIFSAEQIAVAEKSLALWDDLINIRFERTSATDGDINFGNTESAPGSGAYAYLPFGDIYDQKYRDDFGFAQIGRVGGDVWINNFVSANRGPSDNGSYMLLAMLHEIGHSLGLSHTGDYNASQDSDGDGQPDPITYATHAKFFQDTLQYSVMSYFGAEKTGASHVNWHTLKIVLPSTPMVHDVLAAQKAYGADTGTRTGDTVYGFNSNAGRDALDFTKTPLPVVTIWDAGGNDTLDFSGWATNSLINLNEGAFSSGGGTGFLPLDELKARGILPSTYTEEQYAALKAKYNSTDGLLKDNIAIAYGAVIENAVGGRGDDIIIGNQVPNLLLGGAGNDALTGGPGDDTLDGGEGTDTADYGSETGAAGVRVNLGDGAIFGPEGLILGPRQARDSHGDLDSLAGIENARTGAGNDSVYGSAGANRIETGAGHDFLNGREGADTLIGGSGDDVYALTDGDDDIIIELAAEGIDEVRTNAAAFSLAGIANVENLTGISPNGQSLTGNALANLIRGSTGNDNVSGEDGDDTLLGGVGADTLIGGTGNDVLDGGAGADIMRAGAGDDLYIVDGEGDTAEENEGDGTDEVRTALASFSLAGFANIEKLTGTSNLGQTLTGNILANLITGGSGDDRLDGGAGADAMRGGPGDDVYVVDDEGDTALENDGEGKDEVRTSLASFSLAAFANVENLTGTSERGQALTGNGLANVITGGSGDDTLDGGAGADTLRGGAGDDVYMVDDVNDVIIEDGNGGKDEVRTSVSIYVLPANVEVLVYTGAGASSLRANALDNVVTGGAGNDLFLLQDGGEDSGSGGAGDDGFFMGAGLSADDSIDGGEGDKDQLAIQGNYGSLDAPFVFGANNLVNVEGLALVSGNVTLFGDTAGNLYSYNLKTVDANIAAGKKLTVNWSLLQAGENVTFDGSAETNGTFLIYAGQGDDRMTGGGLSDGFFFAEGAFTAADRIDGGGGNDNQIGLRGDYTGARAVVFEAATITNIQTIALLSGKDTRFGPSGPDYRYELKLDDANVAAGRSLTINAGRLQSGEGIAFDGSAETDGSLRFFGGAGDDSFTGGAQNDFIYGGLGADTLRGGGGSDRFVYRSTSESSASAMDKILGFHSADKIDLSFIDADANMDGNQSFSFIGDGAFSQVAGQLRAYERDGNWFVEGDTNGDGLADLIIIVGMESVHPLTANDFAL